MAWRVASMLRVRTSSCPVRATGIPRRKNISIRASSASTADRTRSSTTSSPKRCWGSNGAEGDLKMDIQFTEEQELLRNSVQRLLRDRYDFEARQKIVTTEGGWSRAQWDRFAELGLLAAPLPEEFGGFGR